MSREIFIGDGSNRSIVSKSRSCGSNEISSTVLVGSMLSFFEDEDSRGDIKNWASLRYTALYHKTYKE